MLQWLLTGVCTGYTQSVYVCKLARSDCHIFILNKGWEIIIWHGRRNYFFNVRSCDITDQELSMKLSALLLTASAMHFGSQLVLGPLHLVHLILLPCFRWETQNFHITLELHLKYNWLKCRLRSPEVLRPLFVSGLTWVWILNITTHSLILDLTAYIYELYSLISLPAYNLVWIVIQCLKPFLVWLIG